jgi:hypothetical protein
MTQPALWVEPRTAKCPICICEKHCGHKAVYDEPVPSKTCINTEFACEHCGARGVESVKR